jgi:hypothetical protein
MRFLDDAQQFRLRTRAKRLETLSANRLQDQSTSIRDDFMLKLRDFELIHDPSFLFFKAVLDYEVAR